MDTMMTGCVQYPLQRSQLRHQRCMDPELVQIVEVVVDQHDRRRNEEGEWKVEETTKVLLKNRLTQCGEEVEVLGAVMNHVLSPENKSNGNTKRKRRYHR